MNLFIIFVLNLKNKIDLIFRDLKNEVITEKQAHQQVLDLFADSCRLFTIKYHSSYAVFDMREVTILAKDKNDALDKFWNGKNKESWEVTYVSNGSDGIVPVRFISNNI